MRRWGLAVVLGLTLPLVACFPDEDLAFRDDWLAADVEFRATEGDRERARFDSLDALRAWSPVPLHLPAHVPLGVRLQGATVAHLPPADATASDDAESWTVVLLFSTGNARVRHVVASFPAAGSAARNSGSELTEEPLAERADGRVDSLLRWHACGSDFTMSVVDAPSSYLPHARVMARSIAESCRAR